MYEEAVDSVWHQQLKGIESGADALATGMLSTILLKRLIYVEFVGQVVRAPLVADIGFHGGRAPFSGEFWCQ